MLDKMCEDALTVILEKYDGNTDLAVSGSYDSFPAYMKFSMKDIFTKLKITGTIASYSNTLAEWQVYLTPSGVSYFESKQRCMEAATMQFKKLPANSKRLLDEILQAENPTQLLCERFERASHKEDEELRSLIRELSQEGYIHIPRWADNMPQYIQINNSARTYNERLQEYEQQIKMRNGITYNIGTINNQSGVFTIGDISNSAISVDNSIQQIENEIENKGGEDKEALSALLEEAKELIDSINATRRIPKNSGFFKRLSTHLEKHGWFYAEIVGLIGATVLQLLQG